MKFDLTDRMQYEVFLRGAYYEGADIEFVAEACARPSTMFLDIGANIGIYSFTIAKRFPEALVCAFEPNPRTFAKLQETKSLGDYPNLTLVPVALSDAAGTAILNANTVNSGWSTLGDNRILPGSSPINVPLQPFDEWWQENRARLPRVDQFVIKMDIEGYETRALRGMRDFLVSNRIPLLQIEFFSEALRATGSSTGELFAFLLETGFTGYSDHALREQLHSAPEAVNPTNAYFRGPNCQ